jgi:hypothetical protein
VLGKNIQHIHAEYHELWSFPNSIYICAVYEIYSVGNCRRRLDKNFCPTYHVVTELLHYVSSNLERLMENKIKEEIFTCAEV